MENKIEVGDSIRVNINSVPVTVFMSAEVLKVPECDGGVWQLLDKRTSRVHFFNERCTMEILDKKKPE